MTPAITALAAALLLGVASSVQAQDTAGTPPVQSSAAPETGSSPGKPIVGIDQPKITPKMVIDVFNVLTRPRPAPAPAEPAVAAGAAPASTPVEPAAATTVFPAPAAPPVATPAAAPAATPRDVKPASSSFEPRAPKAAAPSRPIPPIAAPEPTTPAAQPAEKVPTLPPPPAVARSLTAEAATPVAGPEPTRPTLIPSIWMLLGLLAAAVVAASVIRLQRTRRIERTRAVLALKPRIDFSVGASSLSGLSLASPPLAIRARLAT